MAHKKTPVDIRIFPSLYQDPAVILIRLVKPAVALKTPGLMIELLNLLQPGIFPFSFKVPDALLDICRFLTKFFNIVSNPSLLLQECPGSLSDLLQFCGILFLNVLHPDHKVVGQLLTFLRIHLQGIELADNLALGLYFRQGVILRSQDAV